MISQINGATTVITLTDDESALIKSILIALRGIKVRDIDKALVLLSKGERRGDYQDDFERSDRPESE